MNKLIKSSILLVALIAIMGTAAAAYNMAITDPASTVLTPGDATGIDYTIALTGNPNLGHTVEASVTTGTASDLEFRFLDSQGGDSGWIAAGAQHTWSDAATAQAMTMKVRAISTPTDPQGTVYSFTVIADTTASQSASASTTSTSIPEFPTIALPIAAILGLAFYFQRRKE